MVALDLFTMLPSASSGSYTRSYMALLPFFGFIAAKVRPLVPFDLYELENPGSAVTRARKMCRCSNPLTAASAQLVPSEYLVFT